MGAESWRSFISSLAVFWMTFLKASQFLPGFEGKRGAVAQVVCTFVWSLGCEAILALGDFKTSPSREVGGVEMY